MGEESLTEELLQRAGEGDAAAIGQLLHHHRQRLRRMVAFRMDPRLSARLDASDVVQETLAEAADKIEEYIRKRPLPLYAWLRQIASRRLVHQHVRHLWTGKRSVNREEQADLPLSDRSALHLARQLQGPTAGPSSAMIKREQTERLRAALQRLRMRDREVLILRYVEQLPAKEIAAILDVTPAAVNMRHIRALERLRELVEHTSRSRER